MLILLFLVVIALAITPNCLDRDMCVEHIVSPNYDVEKLSEELTYEEFMTDLKIMRDEIHEETLIAKDFTGK